MTSSPLPDDNQRRNLAVNYRLIERFQLPDSIITHISAVGGDPKAIWRFRSIPWSALSRRDTQTIW